MGREPVSNETGIVRMERVFRHPPEKVWRALTDPRALSQWLLPTDFRAELGYRFRFRQRSEQGQLKRIDCRVVELEAPYRLAYLWHSEEENLPTLVTWTLEPVEAGTCLRVEHINPDTVQNSTISSSISALRFIGQSVQNIVNDNVSRSVGRVVLSKQPASVRCIGRPIARLRVTRIEHSTKSLGKEVSPCTR